MKPARILILFVAVAAAGLAGLLAMGLSGQKRVVVQQSEPVVTKEPTTKVLIAAASLPVGARLTDKAMRWMDWPKTDLIDGFVTEENRPQALSDLAGLVVRLPIFEGEPIRIEKIADASSRTLSALLPAGKRAISTEISVATGAGGFILPNDRVDVIMVRKGDNDNHLTETVLSNVRVLAIDQQIEEKNDGTRSVIGTTATLELTPEQTKVLTVAQQMAERLSLALRSVADAQEQDNSSASYLLSGDSGGPQVQVIKSGQIVKSAGAAKQ
ncbi:MULTISPECIES: Flp pilus assembly protein CpaB [Rhizobium/Agrobacterium group]|uniref:Flp pilus assembly protein CpaB n=1 Tax=Rhizobium/Agrobacterium group TaxID=227290 RepID=UPI0008DC1E52|nr:MULTISPECIES: Flp pilus assembly protein CpaB [Rhizobium/Agrobacterium group]MCF1435720.1 Flp pilus assembly protein CpaB [Allorhizobium ampelinum]MUO90318.1 Flp pilus assembly protein CpaB [Agrobacterium vitis]MUZ52329.1 Flp pilus assembly protein CpaB [Agrobacterium vitis]MUZ91621.1 Flp pilus assembly protein CpaB [Agrobacterium vitis]MVA39709.1 Flp pilus assembly protein CpaB [Agrobacterium vitis]